MFVLIAGPCRHSPVEPLLLTILSLVIERVILHYEHKRAYRGFHDVIEEEGLKH